MAGRGPAPKDPERRARGVRGEKVSKLAFEPAAQPDLPDAVEWSAVTRSWWSTWGASSQAGSFTATDWAFLLDTALLHHAVWAEGDLKALPELRLRVAKFGATPEDRARLRMQFAEPDQAPAGASGADLSAYAGLRAV